MHDYGDPILNKIGLSQFIAMNPKDEIKNKTGADCSSIAKLCFLTTLEEFLGKSRQDRCADFF
jgi:hypothetical protein